MSGRPSQPPLASTTAESFYRELWRRRAAPGSPLRDEVARWREIERLLDRLDADPDRDRIPFRVLDLGCGRGWLTQRLAERYGEQHVRGIDPLAASVDLARSEHDGLEFRQATAGDLLRQGEASSYDLIVCSEVIEHVPYDRQAAFLTDARELLRPGGHLVLTTPRGELWARWRRRGGKQQPVEAWLTEPGLAELAQRSGFEVRDRSRAAPPRRPLGWQGWADKWLLGRRGVRALPLGALRRTLQHAAAIYQVLLLRRTGAGAERRPK